MATFRRGRDKFRRRYEKRKRHFSHPQGDPSQERRGRKNRPAPFEMTGFGGSFKGTKTEERVGLLRSIP